MQVNCPFYTAVAVQSVIYEYCASCQKRLQWIVQVGAKRGLRKPNMDEVRQAKVTENNTLTSLVRRLSESLS